ncbi:MAG: hypothetical protein KDJ65_35110 [Anaerolineae bacterium]|nr:hypothetical protein [Anaerolineae bacterium]
MSDADTPGTQYTGCTNVNIEIRNCTMNNHEGSFLEQYLCETLLLIVGSNPLPNYVAASLLLKENGRVFLIHTPDTLGTAKRLQQVLCEINGVKDVKRVPIKSSSSNVIIQDGIAATIASILGQGQVGLNYTGGTKAMAVHIYRMLEQIAVRESLQPVFSYLDPGELRIIFDGHGNATTTSYPVAEEIQVPLEVLLKLHNIDLVKNAPLRTPYLLKTAHSLANLHSTTEGIKSWRQWCQTELRRSSEDKFKPAGELKKVILPDDGDLATVTTTLRQEIGCTQQPLTLADVIPFSPWQGKKQRDAVEDLARWLFGQWLEHFAYNEIQKIAVTHKLHPSGMGIGLDTDREKSPYDFEVDVAAIYGYQLFGLSCTMDNTKNLCKAKLFEAEKRVHQLGGDEACVGLVSCYDKPQRLEKEMLNAWGMKPNKVRVFGYQDLMHLSDKLDEWFSHASGK